MRFVQFFNMSTGYVENSNPPRFDDAHKHPIEVCGDRGVVVIDARLSRENTAQIARNECMKRGFVGYRIFEGRTFSDCKAVSGYWPVPHKQDKTALNAVHGN